MGLHQAPSTFPAPSQASERAKRHQDLRLPPPQTFDILPALHELLARIDHTSPADPSIPADLTDSSKPSTADTDDEIGALYFDLPPLEPKELPAETLQIKAKIRTALKAVEKLPDVERGVEEQRVEIEELEARIRRQREMVERLAEVARGMEGRVSG